MKKISAHWGFILLVLGSSVCAMRPFRKKSFDTGENGVAVMIVEPDLSKDRMLEIIQVLSLSLMPVSEAIKDYPIKTGIEKDDSGTTFLHMACMHGSLDLVGYLLSINNNRGHASMLKNNDQESLLHFACRGNNVEVVRLLLKEHLVSLEEENSLGHTPLFYASYDGHTEVVALLLSHGAEVNHLDNQGATSLHWACWAGRLEVVKTLVEAHATIDILSGIDTSPLHNACLEGHIKVVRYLVSKGATVDFKTADGITPLHNACLEGHIGIAQHLVLKGADIDAQSIARKTTPLINACYMRRDKIVRYLVKKGATLNMKDVDGETVLHYAACNEDEVLVKLLLDSGAQKDVSNNDGEKPADMVPPQSPAAKHLKPRRKKKSRDELYNRGILKRLRRDKEIALEGLEELNGEAEEYRDADASDLEVYEKSKEEVAPRRPRKSPKVNHPKRRPARYKKKSKPQPNSRRNQRPKPQGKRKKKPKQEKIEIIDLAGPDELEIKKEPKRRKVDIDLVAEEEKEEEEKARRMQLNGRKERAQSTKFNLLGPELVWTFGIKDLFLDDLL